MATLETRDLAESLHIVKAELADLHRRIATSVNELRSVLCSPDGDCCIGGSDGDRAVVDGALNRLMRKARVSHWRQKAQSIMAVQVTPDNAWEIAGFMGCVPAFSDGRLMIMTPSGRVPALPGFWVIRCVGGTYDVLSDRDFHAKYEAL